MMYNGKEVCQGCKSPGSETPRWNKNDLCSACQKALNIGLFDEKERQKYRLVFLHWHHLKEKTSKIGHKILSILHNPAAEAYELLHFHRPNAGHVGSNGVYYHIPFDISEPLHEFLLYLDKNEREYDRATEDLPKIAKAAAEFERDKIYNEGVEMGKNLLLQLESGGLSMDDFARNLQYSKH